MFSLPKNAIATVDLFSRLYRPKKADTLIELEREASMQSSRKCLAASVSE